MIQASSSPWPVLSLVIVRIAIGVPVGVDSDDGVDEFCQHGHRPGSFRGERVNGRHRPGWGHHVAHL